MCVLARKLTQKQNQHDLIKKKRNNKFQLFELKTTTMFFFLHHHHHHRHHIISYNILCNQKKSKRKRMKISFSPLVSRCFSIHNIMKKHLQAKRKSIHFRLVVNVSSEQQHNNKKRERISKINYHFLFRKKECFYHRNNNFYFIDYEKHNDIIKLANFNRERHFFCVDKKK